MIAFFEVCINGNQKQQQFRTKTNKINREDIHIEHKLFPRLCQNVIKILQQRFIDFGHVWKNVQQKVTRQFFSLKHGYYFAPYCLQYESKIIHSNGTFLPDVCQLRSRVKHQHRKILFTFLNVTFYSQIVANLP